MTSRPLTAAASNIPGANGNSRGLAEALAGIREVTRKMAACEAAMEGRGTYLGIRDPVVLLDQLRTLQRKEEQLREVHLIFLRSAIFTQTASPSKPASLLALPPASSVARQQAVLNPSQVGPGDGHSRASSLKAPVVGPKATSIPLAAAAAPSTVHPSLSATPAASPSPALPAPVSSLPPAPAPVPPPIPAPVAPPVATPAAAPPATSASVSGSLTAASPPVTSPAGAPSSSSPTAPPVSMFTGKSLSLHEALGLASPAPALAPARSEQSPPWLGRHALYRTTSPTNPPPKKSTPVATAASGVAGRTRSSGALPNGKGSSGSEPRANGLAPAAKEQAVGRRERRSGDAGTTQRVAVSHPERTPAPSAAPTPAPTGTPVSTPTSDRAAQMIPLAQVKQESVEAPATSSSGNATKSSTSEELVYMRSLFEGEPPANLQVDADDVGAGRRPETNDPLVSGHGDPASRNSGGDTPGSEGSQLEATPLPADPLEPPFEGIEVAGAPDTEALDPSALKKTGERDSLNSTPIDANTPQVSVGTLVGGAEASAPTTPNPQRGADPATAVSATANGAADGQTKTSSPKAGSSSRKKRKSARSGWRSRYSAEEFELGDTIESSPESSGSAMAGGREEAREAKREGSSGGQEKKRGEDGSTADDGDEDWNEQVEVGGAEDEEEENALGEDEGQRKRKPKPAAVRKRDPPNAWKKRCADGSCQLGASFGMEGQPAIYCSAHKDAGMVNVTHRRCGEPGCAHQPSFNVESEKRAMYCYAHKKPGMINVSSPRCASEGCMVRPSFGFIGDRRASFCDAHKLDGMLNIRKRRRVVVAKPVEGAEGADGADGADPGFTLAGGGASGVDGGHSLEQSFLSIAPVSGPVAGAPGADSLAASLVSGFGDPASPLEKDGGIRVDGDTDLFQADSGSSFLAAVSIATGGDVGVLPEQEQGM